jgi:hypothetical protein
LTEGSAPGLRLSWRARLWPFLQRIPRYSSIRFLYLTINIRCHSAGVETRAAPFESSVYNTSAKLAAAKDELARHPVHNYIAAIHMEVQQGLAAVVIPHEYCGQVRIRRKAKPRLNSVVRSPHGL